MNSVPTCPKCGHEQRFRAGRPAHRSNLYCEHCEHCEKKGGIVEIISPDNRPRLVATITTGATG